jgi:Protein of unknown function (DUF4229)
VTFYVLARLGLVAVVAGALMFFNVPLLPALAVGVVVALPASLFLFKGLRERVAVGLNERQVARQAERDKLRAELRGDEGPLTQA